MDLKNALFLIKKTKITYGNLKNKNIGTKIAARNDFPLSKSRCFANIANNSSTILTYIQGGPPVTPRSVESKVFNFLKICFHSETYIRKGNNLKIHSIISDTYQS